MNQKHRKLRYERRVAHQQQARSKPLVSRQIASVPPKRTRRQKLSKKLLRALGRNVKEDPTSYRMKQHGH